MEAKFHRVKDEYPPLDSSTPHSHCLLHLV